MILLIKYLNPFAVQLAISMFIYRYNFAHPVKILCVWIPFSEKYTYFVIFLFNLFKFRSYSLFLFFFGLNLTHSKFIIH